MLNKQLVDFEMPDPQNIASESADTSDCVRLLQLVLSAAVNSDDRATYIESIMQLDDDVQQVLMASIQEVFLWGKNSRFY